MENQKKKCSSKKHSEMDAINYCQECKIYLCNKCQNSHSDLFETHHLYNIDKNINEIFTGNCKEKDHKSKIRYFCKNHNQLCCGDCITKIEGEGNGQHKDCDICFIKDIKEVKKNKLKENIKCLEDLSNQLEQSINDLKNLFDKINENKESLKLKIQNIFTKIRNIINEREDEILLEVDNQFNNLYFNEDLIKESEKLPNKIKISLEKGKTLDKDWSDKELNCIINDCINIENNIKEINIITQNIQKSNSNKNLEIKFNEDGINNILEIIKKFGNVYYNKFIFKNCPLDISEDRKYVISGEKMNIFTKTGSDNWMGTICVNELEKSKEHKWKIKILKTTQNKYIMVGVAPFDFDIKSSTYRCGWYFYCTYSSLYSGSPHNYGNKSTNLSKVNDEIIIVMNMNKRTLKFIINNEDKGESYTDIPIDKPLFPAVCLYSKNDSVEILEC